jgi:hypothetical protein
VNNFSPKQGIFIVIEFTGLSPQLHIGSNDLMEMEIRYFNPIHVFLTQFFQFEVWLCDSDSRQAVVLQFVSKTSLIG